MADQVDDNIPEESIPLSDEEIKAMEELAADFSLEEFKSVNDICHIRFIRGYWREQNRHQATVDNFRKTLAFRAEINADSLLNKQLDNEDEYFAMWPHEYHGVDRRGHPIYIEKTATVDPTAMMEFGVDRLKEFHIQMQETNNWIKEKQTEKSGYTTYKGIVIMDMFDFGMKHCSSTFYDPIQQIITIDQYYYPESLYKLYLINCPWAFRAIWKVIKPWLHPLTAARIEILGTDYLEHLQELIDDDQIPRYLGGTCECGCSEDGLEHQMDRVKDQFRSWRQQRLDAESNAASE